MADTNANANATGGAKKAKTSTNKVKAPKATMDIKIPKSLKLERLFDTTDVSATFAHMMAKNSLEELSKHESKMDKPKKRPTSEKPKSTKKTSKK